MKQMVLCAVLLFCGVMQGAEKGAEQTPALGLSMLDKSPDSRVYPLHAAVHDRAALEVIEKLAKECDVNQPNQYGLTPLWYAQDGVNMVKLLLDCKASPTVQALDTNNSSIIGLLQYNVRQAGEFIKKGNGHTYCNYVRIASLLNAAGASLVTDVPLSDQQEAVRTGAQFLASDSNAGAAPSASISAGDEKELIKDNHE